MGKRIRKAVIPAAGMGTRFLPATRAIPKEIIPVVDIPMIQIMVEEAIGAGIEDIILVTGRHRDAIANHFDYNYELEDRLEKSGKKELLALSKKTAEMCNVICVRQKNPLGLGHAILTAAPAVGDEPFAILLADDMIDSQVPCTKQLADIYAEKSQSVIGVMDVPREDTPKYGIVGGAMLNDRLMQVQQMIEKPEPAKAPSTLACPGRYVLSPEIFDCLRETKPGRGGEIQLTDGLAMLAKRSGLLAYQFEGDRYDLGDRLGYLEATILVAMRRPELADGLRSIMKKYV